MSHSRLGGTQGSKLGLRKYSKKGRTYEEDENVKIVYVNSVSTPPDILVLVDMPAM